MKLYYTKGACSLACRIIINEIGLACEYIAVDLTTKLTENNQDFKKINPKGAVPVLETNEGDILTENAAIQQYLADTSKATDLLPPLSHIKRYHVIEWLNFVATDLHKGFSVFFNPALPQDLKDQVFKPIVINKFNYVDSVLQNQRFLSGNDFTLPDGYMFVMFTWAIHFGFQLADWQHLHRYYNELKQRKSIVQSLKEEGI